MPGFPADTPAPERPGDAVPGEEVRDVEPFLDPSDPPFLLASSPMELSGEETQQVDGSWSQDGDLQGCGQ